MKEIMYVNIERDEVQRLMAQGAHVVTVESVMENGPTTFRPDYLLDTLIKRMQQCKVGSVIVTNSDGVLMGMVYRGDAEDYLKQRAQAPQAEAAR
jgi:predicted transcriptional regulator